MKEIKYHYRTKLLKTTSEMKFSPSTEEEIMNLFGRLKPEQKEEVAQKAIPIVEQAKTEQESYNKIAELIEQIQ